MQAITPSKRKYQRRIPLPPRTQWTVKPTVELSQRLEGWLAAHPGRTRSSALYAALEAWLGQQEGERPWAEQNAAQGAP